MRKLLYIMMSVLFIADCTNIIFDAKNDVESCKVYVSKTGLSTNTGLETGSAVDTINTGLGIASSYGCNEILIKEGNYTENIVLLKGVSIYGGYSSGDWNVRDYTVYTTTITDSSSIGGLSTAPNYAIKSGTGITAGTLVDGFTIQGGGGDYSSGIFIIEGSPTIQNCTVNGGSGSVGSYGIRIDSSSPAISYNTINGGTGIQTVYGVYSLDAAPSISNNSILGTNTAAVGNYTHYGILLSTSAAVISNNTIDAGSNAYNTFAIRSDGTAVPVIEGNKIIAGTASNSSIGFFLNNNGGLIAQNNLVITSTSSYTCAVYSYGSTGIDTSGTYRNNTIIAATGSSSTYGFRLVGDHTQLIIENNIIYSPSGNTAILEDGVSNNEPASLRNNSFFGFTDLYSDSDGAGLQTTITSMETLLIGEGSTASGNISLDPNFAASYYLQASSPVNVRQGGLDGNSEGWGFTVDRDLVTRTNDTSGNPTNANAAGWSIGTYEFD